MLDGRPKRVECQTCGSQHNYRPPAAAPSAKPARTRAAPAPKASGGGSSHRVKAEAARRNEWETRVLGQAATAFTRFAIDRTFSAGELLLHKKFGEGYVVEVLDGLKVSVMFRDGARTLVHGQKK